MLTCIVKHVKFERKQLHHTTLAFACELYEMNHLNKIICDKGVSPVIGVILLVAVTVALVALATVIVFDIGSDVSESTDATINVQETTEGISVDVIRNNNVDNLRITGPEGSSQTVDANVGSSYLIDDGYGSYSVVAVLRDGSEETIRTLITTGEGETLSGVASINPEIEGATVEAFDSEGNLLGADITNENGSYEFTVDAIEDVDSIVLVVDGFESPELTHSLYASSERTDFTAGEPVDFSFTDERIETVGGEDVLISNTISQETSSVKTISTLQELQVINNYLSTEYKLVRNIDASSTETWNSNAGFTPIGDSDTSFTGGLDGQGYEIDGLTIDRQESNVGLIGYNDGGTVENIGVVNADITGDLYVGGLVGWNLNGEVSESYATGTVNGGNSVGGLVGWNRDGTVSESYATGSVSGDNRVGGLVGWNRDGTVSESYATGSVTGENRVGGLVGYSTGTVSKSYSTGSVTGEEDVGGLVGYSTGTVSESYATGSVTGENRVGGLVGMNFDGATVSESYATGTVNGGTRVGGLVGYNDGGTVSESYWDTESTGQIDGVDFGSGDNIEGLTTSEMQGTDAETNMSELDFITTWRTVAGDYPELQWQE